LVALRKLLRLRLKLLPRLLPPHLPRLLPLHLLKHLPLHLLKHLLPTRLLLPLLLLAKQNKFLNKDLSKKETEETLSLFFIPSRKRLQGALIWNLQENAHHDPSSQGQIRAPVLENHAISALFPALETKAHQYHPSKILG